jgi:hypothetical protein
MPELHKALLHLQQDMLRKATSSDIPHEAEHPLVGQLEAVCRQLQPRTTPTDPVQQQLLLHILSCILDCLYTLWSRQDVAAPTLYGADILPWLLTAWQLQLPSGGEEDVATGGRPVVAAATTATSHPHHQTLVITNTIRILSLLAKQKREMKRGILKQGGVVVPLIVRTTLECITANNNVAENRHDQEEKKSDDAVVQDDLTLREQHELTDALFLFIKELTLRAAVNDQTYMYEQLLDSVLECGCCLQPETATGILWNWAISLPQRITANHLVWDQVRYLWKKQEDDDLSAATGATQRNLSALVGTMVAACTVTESSLSTEEAVAQVQNQTWLVSSLLKSLSNEHHATVKNVNYRRRCMRTIRCLAATEWGLSFFWKHTDSKFGTAIVQILRYDGEAADIETRTLACQALKVLLPSLPSDMLLLGPCLETTMIQIVEDADENVDFAAADKLVLAASQALAVSLKFSPWKRAAGCFPPAFFDQILTVLQERVDEAAFHVGFSELFLQLVAREEEGDNVESTTRIKGISSVLVSYPAVLEIMAILLSPLVAVPDLDASRSNTVQVLTSLANDDDRNKKPMADDENLLTALVNVCLMTNNEGPLKDAAKQLILALVPEL